MVTRAQNSSGLTEVEGGDFETPTYNSAPFYAYAPAGDARWTWSGAAGVQRNGSGLGADAPKGVQTAFLRSANSTPSRFSSQITLDAGTYRVRFKAAQRLSSGGVPIQIKLDNTVLGAPLSPASTAFEIYRSVPFQVNAAGSTYRLELGTDSVGGNAMSLIDAILIEAVPTAPSNGGFETPTYQSAPFYGFGPSGSGWNWSGTAGIQRNGSGLGADAPAGVQTAIVRGGANPGAFSQSVSLGAGNSYRVKFWAAQRATGYAVPIQVSVDGAAIGAPITPNSTAFAAYSTVAFAVGAGSHVVRFATDSGAGNAMSLIDEVTIEDTSSVVLPAPLAPFAPKALTATTTATATTGHAALTWRTVPGASGYRIKRALVAGGPYVTLPNIVHGIDSNWFDDFDLNSGTTYYYRVFAFNGAGAGTDSKEATATLLSLPTVTATGGDRQITLSWDPVVGATNYSVTQTDVYSDANIRSLTVAGRTATQANLNPSTKYFYRVTVADVTGTNTSAALASGVTLPVKPVIVSGTPNQSNGSIRLQWQITEGDVPSRYVVKRATVAGGPYTMVRGQYSYTDLTDSGLASATYYYRVQAFNESGPGPESDEFKVSLIPYPSTPTLSANVTSPNANSPVVNLSWTAAPTATHYLLVRFDANNQYRGFDHLTGLAFTDSTAGAGQTYRYTLYAVNEGGNSNTSNEVIVKVVVPPTPPVPPAAPASLAATAGDSTVALSWNGVSDATSYRLKRGVAAGGPYTVLPNAINATSFSDSGLTNGTTYYYRVYAVNAGGSSPDSNEANAKPVAPIVTPPTAPTNVTATAGDASVSLSWSAVSGATSYNVKRGTASGNYTTFTPNVSSTNFSDSGLFNGTTYYYRVTAVNSAGNSPDSAEVQATPVAPIPLPGAPQNLVATAGNTQIVLSWNAASDAASYKIRRSLTNGSGYTTLPASVTANSYTDTGLTNGTPYYYRVYAVNATGNGPDSDQATATPVAPVTPPAPDRGVDLSIQELGGSTQGEVGVDQYYPDSPAQEAIYSITNRGTAVFRLKVMNKGTASDTFRLSGRGDTPGWKVSYFDSAMPTGGTDISAAVKSGIQSVAIPVSGVHAYRVELKPDATAKKDEAKSVAITAYSEKDSGALDQVVATAVPTTAALPIYRPDSAVRVAGQTSYKGEGIYDFMASDEQTIESNASSSTPAVYNLKITNRGNVADSFRVKLPFAQSGWSLTLYDALSGGTDVTGNAQQLNGFNVGSLAPQQSKEFRLEVKPIASTTGSFSVSAVTTSITDTTVQDVGAFNTTVANVSTSSVVTFTGNPRACAGGIDNPLHKLTLTLGVTNNGVPLPNAPIALSFENNVGHNYGTREAPNIPRKAKIYDPNEPVVANRWKESVTLSTNGSGDIQVIVLSSDVISQPRLVARWQNAIIGSLACDFAAATSKRGVFDPAIGNFTGWENYDRGWTCDIGSFDKAGDLTTGKLYIKFQAPDGTFSSVAGHRVRISMATLRLQNGTDVSDRAEISRYLTFVDANSAEQSTFVATTDSSGVAQFQIKAKSQFLDVQSVLFAGSSLSQWSK